MLCSPFEVRSLLPRIPGYCNSSVKLVAVGLLSSLTENALAAGMLIFVPSFESCESPLSNLELVLDA